MIFHIENPKEYIHTSHTHTLLEQIRTFSKVKGYNSISIFLEFKFFGPDQ